MLKPLMFVVMFSFATTALSAQDRILAQGSGAELHIVHTVEKGENFYSIGRTYGVSPKDIAAMNKLNMDNGLNLGQVINIPLNNSNFVQSAKTNTDNGFTPVYHLVADKETLYRISINNRKVPIENIRTWNNLSGDAVQADSYLIVGWLKKKGATASTMATSTPAPAPAKQETAPAPPPQVQEVAKTAQQAEETANATLAVNNSTPPPVENAVKVVKEEPAKAAASTASMNVPDVEGFEQLYMQQTSSGKDAVSEKGPGAWFRSNAVANSGKYYALHNSAPRGTIVKVTNPLNGKFIYAKVLDAIPQLKQNANLIIKLSDGAMAALGTNETRFYCELSYEQ
ncbi:hypothetical protein COR50_11255 [Chitinophaga caeni]|uniref:LysM domain-containing protein n=1 Tax=Chitinophaga caeni TaxID=2029983 RepID=A0A291QUQ3_9BACT|nr:LysM peptidoglycan-binding domain-containing protein [Chitinophaga caeni]ATL47698.1 hypothetical protein COR50_11255 [Chitinophaga caeni]